MRIALRTTLIAGLCSAVAPWAPIMAAQASSNSSKPEAVGLAGALLSARFAREASDPITATEYYGKAMALDPNNPLVLQRSYSVAASAGNFDVAVKAAKSYYDSSETRLPLAGLLLAMSHVKKGEYDQAWPYIDAITGQSYLSFALPMLRAWAQAPRATADVAMAELIPLQGEATADLFRVMNALLNEFYGRNDDALIHYDSLASRIERQPLSIVRLVAEGYHRLGKTKEVKGLLERFNDGRGAGVGMLGMVEALADPARVHKKVSAADGMAESFFAISQILSQGSSSQFLGDVAVAYGQMAMYLNPDLTLARWVLGSNLAARERFDESNAVLAAVKRSDPAYLASQVQIIENLERMEQKGEALTQLQAIAREFPKTGEIQVAMGDLLRRDEKFVDAIAAYDKAMEIYGPAGEKNWALLYTRGIALERAKQWDRAEADFKRALEINPDHPDVLNYLGYSWIDRGENLDEARRLIELAYAKSPDNGYIVDSLGWAMYLAGDYKGAVEKLERAVELRPGDATLNDHLGDAYWKVGRRNEARFQWRHALTLDPDEKQKVSLKAKLEQGLAANEAP
ncbi:MAG: tetratricopeptide repeat protein [Rhodospirillaceae bacterium]|nr:tetratricopeptide repeat protein [Rhodospirillaceae bacterium]